MIWSCFSANGVRGMEIIERETNAVKYMKILSTNLVKCTADLGLGSDFIF